MTQQLYQQFRQAGITRTVSVRTLNIPKTRDTPFHFLSLKDIQNTFPNAQHFELNGQLVSFLPDHDGTRPQCIAFYPGEILEVLTDKPLSYQSITVTHDFTREEIDSKTSQEPLLSSTSLAPFVAHNVVQTTMIMQQQQMLGLVSEVKNTNNKILAQQDKILALQQEAEEKHNKMLALQLDADAKNDKILTLQGEMLQMQQQALDRLALIYKQGLAILTQTYELHEYTIPRLFIVLPKNSSRLDPLSHFNDQFQLYFLCECGEHTKVLSGKNIDIPHNIHLAKHEGYDLQRPKDFVQKYGRYMLTLLEVIKYSIAFASPAVLALAAVNAPGIIDIFKDPLKAVSQSDIDDSIKYLQRFVKADSKDQADPSTSLDALEGANLRHLEEFIKNKDKHRVLGNLYRIVTPDGHVKWVCIDHYRLAYMEKEQQAFAKAVQMNGGSYEPQLGQVVVKLGSEIRATEFFDALNKARHVHDLDITFDWDCSRSDLQALGDALEKSRVSIVRLDLRQFRTSLGRKLLLTSTGYEVFLRIIELPNMRMIHIALPREVVKLSDVQPKNSSHLLKLSFVMEPYSITKKEIEVLAKALRTDSTLTTLHLKENSVKDNGVQALAEGLKINSTLTTLNLYHSLIGDNGAQALSEVLKINSTLTSLYLEDNSIGDNGALALFEALKINSSLTILGLETNSIGDNGAQALSEALKINLTLTTLGLHTNSIGDNGAQALTEALKINSTLTVLGLETNLIGDNGAQALSEALKINSTLTKLYLNMNSIGDNGARALSEALKINSTLTTLGLNTNSIRSNGAQVLSEALKINSTLTTLGLNSNSIGNNGARALSEALKINSTLTALGLETNSIGDDGAQALSEALKINSTLTTLGLDKNSIGDNGAQALSEALKINSTLTTLGLDKNSIGDNGAQALSEALMINSTLAALGLDTNSIGNNRAQALSEALKINSTLPMLYLNTNSIGDNGA